MHIIISIGERVTHILVHVKELYQKQKEFTYHTNRTHNEEKERKIIIIICHVEAKDFLFLF